MLWIKAFHIIAMIIWFAGLFYLPRIFVYHAENKNPDMNQRFNIMEKKLFYYVTTPGAILTILLGGILLHLTWDTYAQALWLHIKIVLVAALLFFHIYLGLLMRDFSLNRNKYSGKFYRWLNEVPTLALIAIVILVVVKP